MYNKHRTIDFIAFVRQEKTNNNNEPRVYGFMFILETRTTLLWRHEYDIARVNNRARIKKESTAFIHRKEARKMENKNREPERNTTHR